MTAGGGAAAAEFFKVGGAGGFFSSVVDVRVIISDKLQQSMSCENVEVPLIQFFDSGWTFLLCYRDVFPRCKLCRRPARSHRWCSWTRLGCLLLCNDRCLGHDSAENCGISAVAVLTRWSMSLFLQFIDGCGRRCDHAATSVSDSVHRQSSWTFQLYNRDGYDAFSRAAMKGFSAFFLAIFRAPPRCPGVERQFFGAFDGEEFFAIEGSPCQLAQDFVDFHFASLQVVFETTTTQPQQLEGGLGWFHEVVGDLHGRLSDFIHRIVVHRRNEAIRSWRGWLREDPLVRPYRWLRPGLVPPSPFLRCDPRLTPGGSGVLASPDRIDEECRKAWLPYFRRSGQREASLEEFNEEVVGWLLLLPEIDCLP